MSENMDLTTNYLGLDLKHPIVASASPLTADIDGIRRLADAGAAAIVMASIYEEQVIEDELRQFDLTMVGAESQGEAAGYFPELPDSDPGVLSGRLETLRRAAEGAGVPIVASLNGTTREGWVDIAAQLEQAGASAIEIDSYRVPVDPLESGASVEAGHVDILSAIKERVDIPVSVKLAPYFSSPGNMAVQLVQAGADGLVMFSRFFGPDIDLASLTATTDFESDTPSRMRLPLLWTALLAGNVESAIAASGGIESHEDVVKFLLVGADVAMTASSLLRHGPDHMRTLVSGLEEWMASRGFDSIDEVRGRLSVARRLTDPAAFIRTQYYETLTEEWRE